MISASLPPSVGDAMGHRFYGFAPLVAETPAGYAGLTYERPGLPLDSWCVEVNDVVVYQEPEDEENEEERTIVGDQGTGEEDFVLAPVHDKRLLGG
jgi:hypothetical protein